MRTNHIHPILKAAARVAGILSLAAGAAFGQTTVNMTAGPVTGTLADGTQVPMWGYSCPDSSCAALNPAAGAGWSPVVITVPTGNSLTINLTNNLTFTPLTSTTANTIPTSLVIMGQLGGGLGTPGGSTLSPDHTNAQPLTWPIAGADPGVPPLGGPANGGGTPPQQGRRVRSFGTEVAAGATVALCWGPSCTTPTPALKPGTYLLESGSHPSIQVPMGLIGMVVVTTAPTVATPAGTAYPAQGPRGSKSAGARSTAHRQACPLRLQRR